MWVSPEEAVVLPVDEDQIVLSRVTVTYYQCLRFRVILDSDLVSKANSALVNFVEHLNEDHRMKQQLFALGLNFTIHCFTLSILLFF